MLPFINARVAQLVEYDLAKVGVAGSSPVSRSQHKKKDIRDGYPFFLCSRPDGRKRRSLHSASVITKRTNVLYKFCIICQLFFWQ